MLGRHITITPSILYFGTPVVLVVTRNKDGTSNITPVSSAWALGQRVVLGFGAGGQGIGNLLREGECTLNFPSSDLWDKVERIATTTGLWPVPEEKVRSGYTYAADKFALGGFTKSGSNIVRSPGIADCPLQIEAQLLACHPLTAGGAGAPPPLLIVELDVLKVHAHRDIVIPRSNHIDTSRWQPLFYVFRHYFGHAIDLGRNFRAEA